MWFCKENRVKKLFTTVAALALLSGCAYNGHIQSVSGAAEVMPSRKINADAMIRIDPELSNISRRVNTGFVCSAHNYTITPGSAVAESILRTLENSFNTVIRAEAQQDHSSAYFLDFSLDEFAPRLRFNPGFWSATPESTVELSIRVRASKPDGTPTFQTTVRGLGHHEDSSGGCGDGMRVVEEATREAVQRAMEDLAQKLINSRALTDS